MSNVLLGLKSIEHLRNFVFSNTLRNIKIQKTVNGFEPSNTTNILKKLCE